MMLGEKIVQLRKEERLSQEQLAMKLNVSRQAISKWELGDAIPDTEHVIRLAEVFNVSIDSLLRGDLKCQPTNQGKCLPVLIGMMVIGLVVSFMMWVTFKSFMLVTIGWVIQIVTIILFIVIHEKLTYKEIYWIKVSSVWLIPPFIVKSLVDQLMIFYPKARPAIFDLIVVSMVYLMISVGVTIILKKKSTD